MGMLIEGEWASGDGWASKDGSFHREAAKFRCEIGSECHPPEANRYHLYVSLACPWAHRTLIFRKLKQLEALIPVTIVHPHMLEDGWRFAPDPEPLYGLPFLHQIYTKARPTYSGRVTVPVLWDRVEETIVCNESAEIIRMFNTAFDHLTGNQQDYYPPSLRTEINAVNDFVYARINNGVYKCGFATQQDVYEQAFDDLFRALDEIEQRLSRSPYLVGERLTEADWRLFTTLIRFDAVYFGHFKCNRNLIRDMPGLQAYLAHLYRHPGIAETCDFEQIKQHYYYSHASINPSRIVPAGPDIETYLTGEN